MDKTEVSSGELGQAQELTRQALEQRPLDGSAWLRFAYLRSLEAGEMDALANEAVEMSYVAEPLGPEVTRWRLAFVFDHWPSASNPVRELALSEMEVVYPRRGWELDSMVPTVRDPTGRMIAVVAARRLRQVEDSRRWSNARRG